MHPYSTDSNERKVVRFLLAIAGIFAAWLVHLIVRESPWSLWWLEVPSVFGFYVFFHFLFDSFLWHCPTLRSVGLVKVPNLHGPWQGHLASDYDRLDTEHDARIRIRQSWTQISIVLEAEFSTSHSLSASILTEDPGAVEISYEYLNEPKPRAEDTMHAHRGTCRLVLAPDGRALEGEYYSGRDRKNTGILSFERVSAQPHCQGHTMPQNL